MIQAYVGTDNSFFDEPIGLLAHDYVYGGPLQICLVHPQ